MYYIFHGDDTHGQKETLTDLRAKMGDPSMLDLNTTRFERVPSVSELVNACSAVPFLAQVRLVIVNDFFTSKPDKSVVDELLAYLPQMPGSTRLFFLESKGMQANSRVLKLAEKDERGFVKAFSRPEGSSLDRWIRQRVERQDGRISSRAIHMLVTNIGSDLPVLDNEIEKLVLYRGAGEEITADDVALLSPYAAEANIFDLVDALGSRDGRKAAALLHKKLGEGADPFYIFSMFTRQFRLLIQVKELADAGERPPAISRRMKIHSFVAGKLYQQSQHFSMPQLEQIYSHLLDVDVAVKTGRDDMTTALGLLVAGLAV